MPGLDDIDAYEVLGVSPRADDVVIRAAWKALIRKYHPDSSASPDAADRAARINAAFKLLVTPDARAAYDRRRAAPPVAPPRPAPRPKPAPMPQPAARRPAPPLLRRPRRLRLVALAGAAVLLLGTTVYLIASLGFPAPMQHAADGLVTDPAVARMRTNARRMLGLDTPSDHGSQPAAPVADAGPPPAVNEAGITAAAERFDTLWTQGGDAAATAGRKCAAEADNVPGWVELDNCVALHLAGLGVAEGLFGPPDPNMTYFEQAAPELREHYGALSSDNAEHAVRIETIRKLVWATMLRKTEARLSNKATQPKPQAAQ